MNQARATEEAATPNEQQNADLLAETFTLHQGELLGMLYYIVGNKEDARDALQEAFLKCWRRRQSVSAIDNLRAWIFRIALNAGRDLRKTAWRRRRKSFTEEENTLPSHGMSPENEASRNEELKRIRCALFDLRAEEQEVFLLRQNGQMTYEQIAHSINIPLGTVKTRMRLALSKLREALEITT